MADNFEMIQDNKYNVGKIAYYTDAQFINTNIIVNIYFSEIVN